ncbi:MAG TPA: GGDEF domain-containing protein [Candidatus Eisenbacteria bacterium]|nr:GGDEF domain-containing protein [Candidatus Eisenbacteria bacterium]
MWRYLALNSLWFSMLFLVHFFGTRQSRLLVLAFIFAAAAWIAPRSGVDPFAWFFYLSFSLLVFWGAYQFKRWASASSLALDEELGMLTKRSEAVNAELEKKSADTDAIRVHADEITNLCAKIKEMSQCLDGIEAFLVLGEALAKNFRFDCMRLVLFPDGTRRAKKGEQVYELYWSDFQGLFDRSVFLHDRERMKGVLADLDQRVVSEVMAEGKSAFGDIPGRRREEGEVPRSGSAYMAQPMFIHKHVFGVIVILGVHPADVPIFSILVESFVADMERVRLYERVETLAITDGLTGVSVRRHLMERLEAELERSKRQALKLSFLMIDIDNFKHFNDQYGHLVGDVILKEVADTIKKNIREVDLVGRYGGEEFGVFLIETDESGAFFVAERIRRAIAERTFKAYHEDLRLTVSIGCSTYSHVLQDLPQIVESADLALYKAKRQGKNRVHLSSMGV